MRNQLFSVYTLTSRGHFTPHGVTSQAGHRNFLTPHHEAIRPEDWPAHIRKQIEYLSRRGG